MIIQKKIGENNIFDENNFIKMNSEVGSNSTFDEAFPPYPCPKGKGGKDYEKNDSQKEVLSLLLLF